MSEPIPPRRVIPKKAVGEIFQALSMRQSNWLLCDGSNYNTEEYPELFEILSDYGVDHGVLPDCRPRDSKGDVIDASPGQMIEGYGSYIPTYIVVAQVGKPV
jgi:hypothetical protein